MKRSILVTLLVALGVSLSLIGCQNEGANLTAPEGTSSFSPRLIELPKSAALQKSYSTSADITVKGGGVLSITASDPDDPNTIYYDISLQFAPGAAPYDFTASLTTDCLNLGYVFGPHGTNFNKPALFTAKFRGLNLNWVKPGSEVFLWYQHPQGGWSRMPGRVTYDIAAGTLECVNLELPHFSRYGFGI